MHARALRAAGAMIALSGGVIGAAVADDAKDYSKGTHVGSVMTVAANDTGASVSGDVRNSIAAVTGDDGADWLSRVRGGYDYHSDGDSRFWAETVQPLFRSEQSTVFWQARLAHAHDDQTINIGTGYRWLSPGKNVLLGANAFYDISIDQRHQRASVGAEALGPILSLRANYYEELSGWKNLGGGVREHALGGADVALDGQAPYMPWLRVGARYYEWRAINTSDATGVQGTLNADITRQIQVVGTYAGDEDPEGDYYLGVRLRLAGGHDTRPTAARKFVSAAPFDPRDLSDHTLDFVERENRIITESRGGAFAGGAITISRSE